jgi:hypothetical protein
MNKVDLMRRKEALLPAIAVACRARRFRGDISGFGVERRWPGGFAPGGVRTVCRSSPHLFPADQVTDQSERFPGPRSSARSSCAGWATRCRTTWRWVIEAYQETQRWWISPPTIVVERAGQKRIVIGQGGEKLKLIGAEARKDIEALLDKKVMLRLWVKVARVGATARPVCAGWGMTRVNGEAGAGAACQALPGNQRHRQPASRQTTAGLPVVARGVRGSKRGNVLQPFNRVRTSWTGRGSLYTLTGCELVPPCLAVGQPSGRWILCSRAGHPAAAGARDHARGVRRAHAGPWNALSRTMNLPIVVLRVFEKLPAGGAGLRPGLSAGMPTPGRPFRPDARLRALHPGQRLRSECRRRQGLFGSGTAADIAAIDYTMPGCPPCGEEDLPCRRCVHCSAIAHWPAAVCSLAGALR